MKAVAFVTGGWIVKDRRDKDMDALMHVTDWLPTILSFTGADTTTLFEEGEIDGMDQSANILLGETDIYVCVLCLHL